MRRKLLKNRTVSLVSSLALFALLLLPVWVPRASGASAQDTQVRIHSSIVTFVQGENEDIPGNESRNDFYALKIMVFDVPYNVTRVHTNVPANARAINVWMSSGPVGSDGYGWESSGQLSGAFYINVPSAFDRTGQFVNLTDMPQDFLASGSVFVNTTYSYGNLNLTDDHTNGYFVSGEMPVAYAHNVISANLSVFGSSIGDNVSLAISNNNGSSWAQCSNSTPVTFSSEGISLKARIALAGNATSGPHITKIQITAHYLKLSSELLVHIAYLWAAEFEEGRVALDASEPLRFSAGSSYVLMFYLLQGYSPESAEISLEPDTSGGVGSPYPDKDLYLNMSSFTGLAPSITISVKAPSSHTPRALYTGAIAIALVFIFALAYASRRRPLRKAVVAPTSPGRPTAAPARAGLIDQELRRRKELAKRKKELLDEISEVKKKASSGSLPKDSAQRNLEELRSEFKRVRNELAKLARKAGAKAEAVACESTDAYDAMLASLVRIDEDYEKGRLPENTYRSLRKQYVTKAASIMAAKKIEGAIPASPIEAEKLKLLEAIRALDEEHEKGEIDDKVHSELRTSYRKELVEVMKRLDQSGEGG